MTNPSLWDRQRAAARAEIARTALDLFLRNGFEETTVDEIVREAGISRRSFFRYFGTKDDIVLGELVDRGAAIAAAVTARPVEEGPWPALRAAMDETAEVTMRDTDAALALGRMLFETPVLRARLLEKRLRWHELLVPPVAARLSDDDGRAALRASAIVASALACLDAASEAWIASGGSEDLGDLYDEAVAAVRSDANA